MKAATSSRCSRRTAILLVLVLSIVASFAGTAFAAEVHVFSGSFGAGDLALEEHSGVAVNRETGEVYVADTGNSRVAKFSATGAADGNLATITSPRFIAVDNSGGSSQGDIYVVAPSTESVTKLDPTGAPVNGWGTAGTINGLGEIAGIAVDGSGNLWVFNTEALMREFNSGGLAVSQFVAKFPSGEPIGVTAAGIAVDSTGDLYMVRGSEAVTKYSAAGAEIAENFSPITPVRTLAVDGSTDDVYLGLPGEIVRLSSSGARLETIGKEEGELGGIPGMAVRGSNGDIFAANASTGAIAKFSLANVNPPVASLTPVSSVGSTTALLKGDVNPNGFATSCEFQVVTDEHFATEGFSEPQRFPCIASPGSGAVSVAVEAEASALEPGTGYHLRLLATNVGGTGESPEPNLTFSTEPVAPAISRQSVISAGLTDATLGATITPGGSPTTYHFEFVDEAHFLSEGFGSPTTRSTPEEGPLPGDNAEHSVSAKISGLETNTPYRFRIVASNVVSTVTGPEPAPALRTQSPALSTFANGFCPNEALRTGVAAALPDCRAYEMVTPLDKGGVWIAGFPDYFAASPDGSAVSYMTTAGSGFPAGGGGHQDAAATLSTLAGEVWSPQRLMTPEILGEKAAMVGMSRNLRYAIVASGTAVETALFLIDTTDGEITQISPYQNEIKIDDAFHYDAISADGTRVFFETAAKLTADAQAARTNLYLWNRGTLTLVGVLPAEEGGAAPLGGSFGGAYNWYEGNREIGGTSANLYVEAIHAASPDGNQIYFTAGETGQIYLRRGLAGQAPTTDLVSKPNEGVVDQFVENELGGQRFPAAFQEATPNGGEGFFTSHEKLTADAATGEFDSGTDLYRFDEVTGQLVDITGGLESAENPNGAEVRGLLGVSSDGSSGYFAARGALAAGAVAEKNNIYYFAETSPGKFALSYVAQTSAGGLCEESSGGRNWSPTSFCGTHPTGVFVGKSARVSPSGQELVFTKGEDIYLFSTVSGEAICISCSPTGAASVGPAELTPKFFNANAFESPRAFTSPILTQNLSSDGDHVFFETPNSLLPRDTNGPPNCRFLIERNGNRLLPSCMDVYEWEAPNAPGGSCKKVEVDGGCLYLLSTGESKEASYLVDASSDGSTAFIGTTSPLVPVDRDDLYDIYSVRAGGGIPAQQDLPAPLCDEEGCRGAAAQSPPSSSSGTSTFNGPGNPKPKPRKQKQPKSCKRSHRHCGKKKQCSKKKRQCGKKKHGRGGSKKGGRK